MRRISPPSVGAAPLLAPQPPRQLRLWEEEEEETLLLDLGPVSLLCPERAQRGRARIFSSASSSLEPFFSGFFSCRGPRGNGKNEKTWPPPKHLTSIAREKKSFPSL